MKETRDRRTLTQALVLYSRLGASYECRSPFEVSERIRGSVGDNHALALDLWSVYQMLLFLRVSKEAEVTKALHSIYFKPFYKKLSRAELRNEITYRVRRFAIDNYIDERTVYRRLKRAKDIFFSIRSHYIENNI